MRLSWLGFYFVNPVIESAFKKKQQDSLFKVFQLTFLLEVTILIWNLVWRINNDAESVYIVFDSLGIFYTVSAFFIGNRNRNLFFYLYPFLEVWNISNTISFCEKTSLPDVLLTLGAFKGIFSFITLSTASNWIFKCSALAVSTAGFHTALYFKFEALTSSLGMLHYLAVLAMGFYFYNEEKSNRESFGRLFVELENLRRWKFISEKFIPAGIVVVNDILPEPNTKRASWTAPRCLEVLHYNEFFNKYLKINNIAGLLDLFRRLAVKDYAQPLAESDYLGNSLFEMNSVENLHDLLLRKCRRFGQKRTSGESNTTDELKIAEFRSSLSQLELEGVREEKNFEISLFDFRWEEKPCVLTIVQDISEKKKNEKLMVLDKYKDLLMASVSHELKTPLNSIIGITSLLLSKEFDEETRNFLAQIKISGDFLLNEINDILDFSLISKGKLRLNIHSFQVSEIIRQVSTLFEISLKEKNILLLIDYKSNQNVEVNTDFMRLKQVLVNLVGNALKFTFHGSIKISIEEVAGGFVEIKVRDTGSGMRKEIIANLFQVFGTYDETSTHANRHGVGLGLTISKQIVGKLGPEEKIEVESQVGVGSEFKFRIFKDLSTKKSKKVHDKIPRDRREALRLIDSSNAEVSSLYSPPYSSRGAQNNPSSFRKRKAASKSCLPLNLLKRKSGYQMIKKLFSRSGNREKAPTTSMEGNFGPISDEILPGENSFELMIKPPYQLSGHSSKLLEEQIIYKKGKGLLENEVLKILIVDDTPFNILIIENFLNHMEGVKFTCERAFNGEECLNVIRRESERANFFDVIFMDCNMPVMDGFEASGRIREMIDAKELPSCHIFGVSAYSGEKVKEKCLASGMEDYISKPMTQEAFKNFLAKWIC